MLNFKFYRPNYSSEPHKNSESGGKKTLLPVFLPGECGKAKSDFLSSLSHAMSAHFISAIKHKLKDFTYSRHPDLLCAVSLWLPYLTWHWIAANLMAISSLIGCVPLTMASRHCTQSRLSWMGSRVSMFLSEKKNLRLRIRFDSSSMFC